MAVTYLRLLLATAFISSFSGGRYHRVVDSMYRTYRRADVSSETYDVTYDVIECSFVCGTVKPPRHISIVRCMETCGVFRQMGTVRSMETCGYFFEVFFWKSYSTFATENMRSRPGRPLATSTNLYSPLCDTLR